MLVLEFGSILLMLKICDSLSHGAELKLMKICGGKTFAGLHVEHQDSSVQRQWLRRTEGMSRSPSRERRLGQC